MELNMTHPTSPEADKVREEFLEYLNHKIATLSAIQKTRYIDARSHPHTGSENDSDKQVRISFLFCHLLENPPSYRATQEDIDYITEVFQCATDGILIGEQRFYWEPDVRHMVEQYKLDGLRKLETGSMRRLKSTRDSVSIFDMIQKNRAK